MRRFFIKFHSFWVENVLFYTTHIAYVGLLTYSWKIGRKWLSKNKSTQNFTVEKNFTQTFWKLLPSDLRGNHNKAFISIFRTKISRKIDYRPKNYNSSVNHTFRGHPTFMGHIPVHIPHIHGGFQNLEIPVTTITTQSFYQINKERHNPYYPIPNSRFHLKVIKIMERYFTENEAAWLQL